MANLEDVPNKIWLVVLIGFLLGTGLTALNAFKDTEITTASKVNETQANACSSNILKIDANYDPTLYDKWSITNLVLSNATDIQEIPSSNYSAPTGLGNVSVVFDANSEWATCTASSINATYDHTAHTLSSSGITNASSSLSNISEQLPTVGTIIGVLIIIAAVVGMVVYFRGGSY